MIETTYYCDLCKEKKHTDDLYQFYFDSGRLPQNYVLLPINSSRQCYKHICADCIGIIRNTPLEEL